MENYITIRPEDVIRKFDPTNIPQGSTYPATYPLYGVWYPAFITPQTSFIDDDPYKIKIGIQNYIKSNNVGLASFKIAGGPLNAVIDWDLNFKGEGFYDHGVLFWYRYWDMERQNDKRLIPGVDIYISDGDFAVYNGAPHVTENLKYSADILYNYIPTNTCNKEYLAKLLASGPQIDFVTEVLNGSNISCNQIYYRDPYGRILPFLQLMSDTHYDDMTTYKYIDNWGELVTKLINKYSAKIYIDPNTTLRLESNFIQTGSLPFNSVTGPNISIKADIEAKKFNPTQRAAYNVAYRVGDVVFEAKTEPGVVYPTTVVNNEVVRSSTPFVKNSFMVNGSVMGNKLTTREEDFFPDIKNVKMHGLGGVEIETDMVASNDVQIAFGGVIGIQLTNQGSGYTSIPRVSISGGGGTGAAAKVALLSGSITRIVLQSGGQGYFQPPTIFISGGGGWGATAEATIDPSTGTITSINLTSSGEGYTSVPTINIIGCGSGASALAIFEGGGVIEQIILTSFGQNYTSAPTVTISGGGGSGATAIITGVAGTTATLNKTDLTELSSDNKNYCKGEIYEVQTIQNPNPAAFKYVKITGTAKDALIINGEVIDCGLRKSNRSLACNNGSSSYSLIRPIGNSLTIGVKHNTGTTVSANLKIFFGYTVGMQNTKIISNKPFFSPNINNAPQNASKTIERNPAFIRIEYKTDSNTRLYLKRLYFDYLRSTLFPECEPFIHTSSQEQMRCPTLNELDPESHIKGLLSNDTGTYVPAISNYFTPPTYYYGGLTEPEVVANNIIITTPDGTFYHPNPGTPIERLHEPIPNLGISCQYVFTNECGSRSINIPMEYPGYITLTDLSGASATFSLSWNGKTSSGTIEDTATIGIIKTSNDPGFFTFSVASAGSPEDDSPTTRWSAKIVVSEADIIDRVSPSAPAAYVQKGFFHPNFGWTNQPEYLNKTARIQNYKYNSLSLEASNGTNSARYARYIYDYHSHYMYNKQYQPGYNYMFDLGVALLAVLDTIKSAKNIGLPTGGGGYVVSNLAQSSADKGVELIPYTPEHSLILKPAKFDYISLDSYLYTGATLLNDFTYERVSVNAIRVKSKQGRDRLANYLDSPDVIDHLQMFIYNGYIVSSSNRLLYTIKSVDFDQSIIEFTQNLPDPEEEGYLYGFFHRSQHPDDGSLASVLIYRPRSVAYDPYYKTGKWGLLSYGNAVIEAEKYVDKNRYNLITQKTSFSNPSSATWSSPMVFYNNFLDTEDSVSRYQPLCKRYLTDYGQYSTRSLSYYNDNTGNFGLFPDSDQIISNTSFDGKFGFFYIGPYIGPLVIRVYLRNAGSVLSSTKQYTLKININEQEQTFLISDSISYVDFYATKPSALYIYAYAEITETGQHCIGYGNISPDTLRGPYISNVLVGVDSDPYTVKTRTRVSFYKHKYKSDETYLTFPDCLQSPVSYLCSEQGPIVPIAPLGYNKSFEANLTSRNIDFSSFMDMNIFSAYAVDRPIRSFAGNVFFEDFLEPVSNQVFDNAGYSLTRYWLNFPRDTEWKFLTSNGILLQQNVTYKVLINLTYACEGDSAVCAAQYNHNICSDSYSITPDEAFAYLGISAADRAKYIDARIVRLPAACSSIDYCCNRYAEGTSQYASCIAAQQRAIDNCIKSFDGTTGSVTVNCESSGEKDPDDPNPPPPDTNPGCDDDNDGPPEDNTKRGKIYPGSATYLWFTVKNDITPQLDAINEAFMYFFPEEALTEFACSTENVKFTGAGITFKYYEICKALSDKCDYITEKDYLAGEEYIPGTIIDLSPSVIAQGKTRLPTPEASRAIRMYNEKQYRKVVPPNWPVAEPLDKEYDPFATPSYMYSHNFHITGSVCANQPGDLFNINVDGRDCLFRIDGDKEKGFYLRSNCFGEILIKAGESDDPTTSTTTVTITCYDGELCEDAGNQCSDDFDPEDHLPEGAELVSVTSSEEITNFLCEYCGPPSCFASLILQTEMEEECHCPDYASLEEYDYYGTTRFRCVYPTPTFEQCCVVSLPDNSNQKCNFETRKTTAYVCGRYVYSADEDGICPSTTTCFSARQGTPQSLIDSYESQCPNADTSYEVTEPNTYIKSVDGNEESYDSLLAKRYQAVNDFHCEVTLEYAKCICASQEAYYACLNQCGGSFACWRECQCSTPGCATCGKIQQFGIENLNCNGQFFSIHTHKVYPQSYGCGTGGWGSGAGYNCDKCSDADCIDDFYSCTNGDKSGDPDAGWCSAVTETHPWKEVTTIVGSRDTSLRKYVQRSYPITYKSKGYIGGQDKSQVKSKTQKRKTYTITYKTQPDDDSDPVNQCVCETVNLDISVNFNIFPNFMIANASNSGTSMNKDLCLDRTQYSFSCVPIYFTKLNPKIVMTDTANVSKSNCYAGSI